MVDKTCEGCGRLLPDALLEKLVTELCDRIPKALAEIGVVRDYRGEGGDSDLSIDDGGSADSILQ